MSNNYYKDYIEEHGSLSSKLESEAEQLIAEINEHIVGLHDLDFILHDQPTMFYPTHDLDDIYSFLKKVSQNNKNVQAELRAVGVVGLSQTDRQVIYDAQKHVGEFLYNTLMSTGISMTNSNNMVVMDKITSSLKYTNIKSLQTEV